MTLASTPFQAAVEQLRRHGIVLRQLPGEYVVNYRNGGAAAEYRTEELADAVTHGLAMGQAPPVAPPLGPIGKPMTGRGMMYRHNRTLAARRANGESPSLIKYVRPQGPNKGKAGKGKKKKILFDFTDDIENALKPWTCPRCKTINHPPYMLFISPIDGITRCEKCPKPDRS